MSLNKKRKFSESESEEEYQDDYFENNTDDLRTSILKHILSLFTSRQKELYEKKNGRFICWHS